MRQDWCPYEKRGRDTGGGGHVRTEAEIGGVQPEAGGHLGPPAAGRGREVLSPRVREPGRPHLEEAGP